jgi:lipopolysaccharide export system permease protein
MKILHRYVIAEFIAPFLISIGVFTFVMLLDKLLDLLDMIVSKGVPLVIVGEIFVLLLPSMVAVVVPMAVLSGILIAIGRLSGDMEVTAMKACGIGVFRLLLPLSAVAVLLGGILVVFNDSILPGANHRAKNLLLDVGTMRPTARIVSGMFVEDLDNYRILVEGKDDLTGRLRGVVIHQSIPGKPLRTISAMTGTMRPMGANHLRMTLENGQMHELDHNGRYRFSDFTTYTLDMARSEDLVRRDRDSRGDREMSTRQMQVRIDSLYRMEAALFDSIRLVATEPFLRVVHGERPYETDPGADSLALIRAAREWLMRAGTSATLTADRIEYLRLEQNRFEVEIQKKYSIPFACLVFVLLGVPLGLSTRRANTGISLAVSLLFILVYYFFLITGENMADKGQTPAWVAMWAPNIVMGALGVHLLFRSLREGHPISLPDVRELLDRMKGKRAT